MNEVIDKTYELIDYLDNSSLVKEFVIYKKRLLNNQDILNKIKEYQESNNNSLLKKEIFSNEDYANYMKCYNELYYLVMDINKRLKDITGKKGCI